MGKPVGNSRLGLFLLQGWILVARTLAFAVALVVLCSPLSAGLLVWSICIAICTTAILTVGRKDLLPHCFLASSTMWTGAAVSIWLSGGDGIAVLFALSLSAIDSAFFISSKCRGTKQ